MKHLVVSILFLFVLSACGNTMTQLADGLEGLCKIVPAMIRDTGENAKATTQATQKAVGGMVEENTPESPPAE